MEKKLDELIDIVLAEDSISEEVKRQTEWVIGDTIVAALYGLKSEEEIIRYLDKATLHDARNSEQIPILGTPFATSIKDNLMIHGTAIVANELDEGNTFAKGHPSAHILPALFVSAYQYNVSTEKIIEVYVKAYEISSRLSYAFSMQDKLHPHGTWGNVGGAVARALIEGKNREEVKQVILTALSLPLSTAWLAAEKGQTVRNLYTGIGSFLAYESVNFADFGFTTNVELVENVWGDILGTGIQSEKLTTSLMNPPMIAQNYMKVYPACRFTHAAIDAVRKIMAAQSIEPATIDEVIVDTYVLAARCDVQIPQTKLASKFSIPYAVACTLLDVDLFANYEDNLPKVSELSSRIYVNDDKEITALLPKKRAARVKVKLTTGEIVEQTVYTAQGEFTHRFDKQTLLEKYTQMLADYSPDFVAVLKDNLVNIRQYETFNDWLRATGLIGGSK